MAGRYFSCLAARLEDIFSLPLTKPDLVVFEAPLPPPAQSGERSARVLIGLAGVVEMICFEHEVRCEESTVEEVRRLVLGRSRFPKGTSKGYVMQWARGRGLDPADDNAADALALLHYRHLMGRTKVMAGRLI
jgi:Holliday junction resolvasome RuvABC endonuclease subunit